MCVADPRERTPNAHDHENARHNSGEQHRFWVVLAIVTYEDQAEDKPRKSRRGAARMDAAKVLEGRSTAETEPQGGPLRFQNVRNNVRERCPRTPTFANNILVSKYRSRPNSSLRASIAVTRLPKTSAPVYFLGYCHVPKIARVNPTIFSETMKVKNFLMTAICHDIY
jgi:hypothetical protein